MPPLPFTIVAGKPCCPACGRTHAWPPGVPDHWLYVCACGRSLVYSTGQVAVTLGDGASLFVPNPPPGDN